MTAIVLKRTFAASKKRLSKAKRAQLNADPLTSDKDKKYKWLLRRPFLEADGKPHRRFPFINTPYRTKRQAIQDANRFNEWSARNGCNTVTQTTEDQKDSR